ncbi:MAG TPA: hypothetical protein VK599_01775, partial [Streptosporangiaceae bacterium]|nr:hypothetical protein [Streptosporangiaceae bacterium]
MRAPAFGRRRAGQISEAARTVAQRTPETLTVAARTVAQRTPETLTVARHRAQPAAVTIVRLAGTAILAYLIALLVPLGTPRPVLAP